MGHIWANRIWDNLYRTHVEPGSTSHMGHTWGSEAVQCNGDMPTLLVQPKVEYRHFKESATKHSARNAWVDLLEITSGHRIQWTPSREWTDPPTP